MLHYDDGTAAGSGTGAQLSNQGAGTYGPFRLIGGRYQATAIATFGGGTAVLNQLGPDGTTYLQTYSFSANGGKVLDLPPGDYQWVVVTATGVYTSVVRIPLGE